MTLILTSFKVTNARAFVKEKVILRANATAFVRIEIGWVMKVLEELRKEFEHLLGELNLEEERLGECSSVAVSRARRGRYSWLILTGKVRENGKVRTKLIRNFYGNPDEIEPFLLC